MFSPSQSSAIPGKPVLLFSKCLPSFPEESLSKLSLWEGVWDFRISSWMCPFSNWTTLSSAPALLPICLFDHTLLHLQLFSQVSSILQDGTRSSVSKNSPVGSRIFRLSSEAPPLELFCIFALTLHISCPFYHPTWLIVLHLHYSLESLAVLSKRQIALMQLWVN